MINKLAIDYPDFTRAFGKWCNTSSLPVGQLLKLPLIFQLIALQNYIVEAHNIGINYDIGAVVAYYYEPQLNVNEVIALSKTKGSFTFNIIEKYDLKVLDFKNSYKRAILTVIEYINNPF